MEIHLIRNALPLPGDTQYLVPREVIRKTVDHLRDYGRNGLEGVGYWGGRCNSGSCQVRTLLVPNFKATAISYDVSPSEAIRIREELESTDDNLLAQIHSHPGDAFHSSRDDQMAASPWAGFVSIVVPNGGTFAEPFFRAVEVFEHLGQARWRRLTHPEKENRFTIL